MRTMAIAVILLAGLNAYAAEKPEKPQPDAGSAATVEFPKAKPDGVTQGDLNNLQQKKAGGKEKQPNPLNIIAGEMIKAQVKLKQGESGADTQASQANAIKMLDKLIDLAEQQQQNQQNQQNKQQQQRQQNQQQNAQNSQPQNSQQQVQSQQQQSTQAAQESREAGAGGKAATDDQNNGAKGIEWGNLPPKAREEYDQILKEDFPEVYKRLLELYYRNLSE